MPFATLRDVYMLLAGVCLGVLLGPAVLGRVVPEAYAGLFEAGPFYAQIVDFDEVTETNALALRATDVTPDAEVEMRSLRGAQRAGMVQAMDAVMDRTAMLRLVGVGVALFVVMLIEAMTGPSVGGDASRAVVSPWVGRWVTVRYALLAVGTALLVARPGVLLGLPWGFVALLVVVGAVVGLVPLGRRRA